MELPPVPEFDRLSPKGLEVMPHQSRFLEAVRDGHRTLPARRRAGPRQDRGVGARGIRRRRVPAAGRRAQRRQDELGARGRALDAAAARHRHPRRRRGHRRVRRRVHRQLRDPRPAPVVARLDSGSRAWSSTRRTSSRTSRSQRSQNVLALAARIREQVRDPLLLALTGTPLINDVEDFDAIWRFLGWTTGEKPGPALMERLDETGLTPADKAFYPEARDAVISMGIVRRKKKDVAADLPDKLIADLPVELDDEFGRSIRQAERELGERLAATLPPHHRGARRPRARASARSTPTSCAWSRRTSSTSPRPPAPAPRTSSRWSARSVRRRRCSRRTTPCSCSARSARSSSSRSTST